MAALTEAGLLAAWESGLGQDPVRRALALAVEGGAEPATVADLSVGDREEFLVRLRESCFGPSLGGAVTCPACGEDLELDLGTAELRAPASNGGTGRVYAGGFEVEIRAVTSRDLLAIRRDAPDARRRLLLRCVVSAGRSGEPVDAAELPGDVLEAVARELSTLDPQADVRLDLDCVECGHEWSSPFDIGDYLWAELEAYAQRLLHDVHALAVSYGWSEAEVLAVSPARRRCYLEMAGL